MILILASTSISFSSKMGESLSHSSYLLFIASPFVPSSISSVIIATTTTARAQHHQPQQPTKIIFFLMMLRKNGKKWKEDHLWIAVLLFWCSVLFHRLHTAPHTTTYHKYIDAYANDDENKLLWVFFFYFSFSAIKWVHFYYFVNCEAKTKNMQRTEQQEAESREWRGIV